VVARRRALVKALLVTAAVVGLEMVPVAGAHAQHVDSTRVGARHKPPPRTPAPDTVKPPISPKRAFLYSLVVPGYGQSVLNRPIAGSLFFGADSPLGPIYLAAGLGEGGQRAFYLLLGKTF